MNKTNSLAVQNEFQLTRQGEGVDDEILAELRDEEEDLDHDGTIFCRKIKIPPGGALFFQVEADDDETSMKFIDGVVVFTHKMNGRWIGQYGDVGGSRAPACSSMDGKTGIVAESGRTKDCEACQFNQYGSAGAGKACKNMRRLYLMMSGDPNLYLLTVPPTSLLEINKQLQRIRASGTPYTSVIVRLSLERSQNGAGTGYSRVKLERVALLPPEVAAKARAVRKQLKEQYQAAAVAAVEFAAAAADDNRVQEDDVIPIEAEADLPF